jgi:alpha-L-rhamnosidase
MTENFGPLRPQSYLPEIGRSNMFIGNYLRFFWLCEEGEYDRVLTEMLEYFAKMANETGTLWEHDSPQASCNHGFASVAAVLILRCTLGFDTVKNGRVVFLKDAPRRKYNVKAIFKEKEKVL